MIHFLSSPWAKRIIVSLFMITRWESRTNKMPETYAKSLQSLLDSLPRRCDLFKLKIPPSIKKVLFIGAAIINLSKQARFVFGKSITQPLAILIRDFIFRFKKFNFRLWFILRTLFAQPMNFASRSTDTLRLKRRRWKFVCFFLFIESVKVCFHKIWTFSE